MQTATRDFVQLYFREARPEFLRLDIDPRLLGPVDHTMQELLRLSQAANPEREYSRLLGTISRARRRLAAAREQRLAQRRATAPTVSPVEASIVETLRRMSLFAAADSYEQAIRDIQTLIRVSFRGTAAELREVLREVLDHLAPDEDVMKMPGFQLEADRTGPTMRQKARFILRSRELPQHAGRAPEDTVVLFEERSAALVRSTYGRGSVVTHVVASRAEVQQLKMYVDAVLADLLQLHGYPA